MAEQIGVEEAGGGNKCAVVKSLLVNYFSFFLDLPDFELILPWEYDEFSLNVLVSDRHVGPRYKTIFQMLFEALWTTLQF